MTAKTLEELKRENAEAETQVVEAEIEEVEEPEEIEQEPEYTESDDDQEDDQDEDEEDEGTEAWMKSEKQGSQKDAKFTSSDIAAAKRKLKAKLEQKDSELEELKAEVERLRSGQVPVQTIAAPKPRREQFLNADDPDEAYAEALVDWKLSNTIQQANSRAQQQQAVQALNAGVDRHYKAAAELVAEHGISEDVYRQADEAVKRAIDAVMPRQGELVTNQLINFLGEGSEKAMFYVGRNPNKLLAVQQALREDPSGIKAAMMLGEIKASVSMPKKATQKAPAPAKRIQGDAPVKGSALAKKLQKQYSQAHKSGNIQAAFNARKQAKKAGLDVSDW